MQHRRVLTDSSSLTSLDQGSAPPVEDRVMTIPEVAAAANLSIATLRRRIAAGEGPRIVRLSMRRRGVRLGDYRRWLDALSA
jgi:predicted DNA-binding transcriptional regulator AlpA